MKLSMYDSIIIGGGLIGMLTARELAMAGLRVMLVDQGRVGQESSWAGGGIISPLYPWRYHASITALARWGQTHYAALADTLRSKGGIDPEYTVNGLLILDPHDMPQALSWASDSHQTLRKIDPAAILDCEPALTTAASQAAWMPTIAQIRNPRLVKAVFHALEKRVEIRQSTQVTGLSIEKGQIRGIETSTGTLTAKYVIVCAGAWTGQLLQQLIPPPPIEPVLGQMILLRSQPGAISRILLHNDRYFIPRRDGRVLVGSTVEYQGFDKRTTEEARQSLKQYALDHFPVLEQAEIEHHWAGLRPGSPQGIPYIGPAPGIAGLYINAGHFRNGVVLGPASARLMADLVLDREPILDPTPYAVDAPRV